MYFLKLLFFRKVYVARVMYKADIFLLLNYF